MNMERQDIIDLALPILYIALGILACYLIAKLTASIFRAIRDTVPNTPTWKGIIISALLGALPFYLVMCFFGWMGEERNRYDNY